MKTKFRITSLNKRHILNGLSMIKDARKRSGVMTPCL